MIFLPLLPQLVLFIAEHLECHKEDCEALVHMLKTFLKQLHLDREVQQLLFTLCMYSSLTTCVIPSPSPLSSPLSPLPSPLSPIPSPLSQDLSGMVERSRQNEVLLLYLRFFNILMSRKKVKQNETKV